MIFWAQMHRLPHEDDKSVELPTGYKLDAAGSNLVSLSKPSYQVVETDQRTAQVQERLMDVVPPLVADREPTVFGKPGQCALHHPPVSSQLLAALYALPGYAALDAALPQSPFALLVVVGFVGVQLLRALPRPATRALYGLYGVHELLEDHRVVNVGPARHQRQRDAPSVRNKVALRARFSLIRWILAGFLAPLFAGMEAESKAARSQSIRSASPRRSKRTLCSLSHTPASCHSRKRRQQVTPEPQPISCGSISQGMPLFKTKMMPASAERLSTRGLPPFGLGGSSGNNGSIVFHSSSDTSSLAMSFPYPNQRVLKGSLRLAERLAGRLYESREWIADIALKKVSARLASF